VATCAPYTLDGELEQEGNALRLRVLGRFVDGCPVDVVEELAYRATVRDLASDTYQLQVSYRRPEMAADSTVFDRTVQVP